MGSNTAVDSLHDIKVPSSLRFLQCQTDLLDLLDLLESCVSCH
jgi:hypothetical protein